MDGVPIADNRCRSRRGAAGVVLLVLLIGVALILVLAFGNLGGKSYTQTVVDAKKEGESIVQAIDYRQLAILVADYRQQSNKLPSSMEDLDVPASTFKDQWGRPVRFRFEGARPADAREVIVVSSGPDGRPGTPDDTETRAPLPY
ncbi:MAG TPA: hypothetical protein DEB06_05435 [Phycisphaerales bacterium]|nr:hypothetical protein [Phycisphaerales bacterium]